MINELVKSIIEKEANAVSNIPVTESYEKAVNLIYEQVHKIGRASCRERV